MVLKAKLFGQVYKFSSVKEVLAKAGDLKSGEVLCGIAASSEQERLAAKIVLSDLLVSDLRNNPVVPYEEDEVTRVIQDDLNEQIYKQIKNWSISELREYILSDKTGENDLKRIMRGLSAETIAGVSKLMGNMDLVYGARKIRNVTHCNTTLGAPGILASRLQPNHPSDDPDGIRMSIFEGLSYASGDCVIGINPATTNLDTTRRIMDMLQDIKDKYEIPTQVCYLVHVSTMMEAMRSGSPSDLIFASIAGTQKCNDTFGVSVDILEEAKETALKYGTSTGPNVMYFETGQGPENAGNMHYGADMATLEARTYGFGKHFDPFIVNDVVGFVGPEVQYDAKQCTRSMLEDVFMAKMSGIPIGTDIAFSSHVKADYNDNDVVMMAASLAGTEYWIGVPGAQDVTTYNMDTSFHDCATIRNMLGLRTIPEFEKWCQKWGILDENGNLGENAGDASIFL
ncbi:MAG: ethanolamine ammonia-lyase subunit EutB [Emergencia sp.]|nr:ethanolamine ammonia-lyase subunit EutB [Emergencia sp.]